MPAHHPSEQRLKRVVRHSLGLLIRNAQDENNVPTEGSFQPFRVTFRNPDRDIYAGDIHLIIRDGFDEPRVRYFDVQVESPSGRSTGSTEFPFWGTKQKLLATLRGQLAEPSVIMEVIRRAADSLAENNMA